MSEGAQLEVTIHDPRGQNLRFKATVTSVIKNSQFSWIGRFLYPGIYDGEHIFTISKNAGGSLFVQKENFSGFLVPFLWGSLKTETRSAFVLMNEALKQRAENMALSKRSA